MTRCSFTTGSYLGDNTDEAIMGNQPTDTDTAQDSDVLAARPRSTFTEQTFRSRLLIACVFWILCLTLSAAGHRLYKAIVVLDRQVSSNEYRTKGVPLVWVGYGTVEDSYKRVTGAGQPEGELHVLPTSRFWLGTALFLSVVAGVMAWSGRWIGNNGIQSLVGLFAGHLLWLGTIELGLDAAGRRLGLAASLEVVGGRAVGTHGAGTLIQLSVVFLIPVLIGLTMHESNRCAVFHWLRTRLPIVRRPSPSGRVDNYAARTATQFFMTVWFCYVSVLWLADPLAGSFGGLGLLCILLAIIVATPYMIWRTARQPSVAQGLRYSVSGAVIAWTAIEIAASLHLFREPWLSTSFSSGVALLGLSLALTGLAARFLFTSRPSIRVSPLHPAAAVSVFILCIVGCTGTSETATRTAVEIEQRLRDYDAQVGPPQAGAADALLRALGSDDPEMRAQAAIALGKSGRVNAVARQRLESMASSDKSRLAQLAALRALGRLDLLSPELEELLRQLDDDQNAAVRICQMLGIYHSKAYA